LGEITYLYVDAVYEKQVRCAMRLLWWLQALLQQEKGRFLGFLPLTVNMKRIGEPSSSVSKNGY